MNNAEQANNNAAQRVYSYVNSVGDSWRNDFCENEDESQGADDLRREDMINDVMSILECTYEEAEQFCDSRIY